MGAEDAALAALESGIMSNPAWEGLTAVQQDRCYVLPKDLFHYKPNARWAESYAYMAKLLYPELAEDMMRPWHKGAFLLILLLCCLAGAVCLSLFTGSSSLSLGELYHALQAGDKTDTTYRIFLYVRLPRTLAAIFAGAALAVSGAIIQAVLNNSLASPNIIGVNSGAGFCALLAASLAPTAWAAVPLAAFVGALATSLFIYALAAKTGASRITLVLAGVAVSSILSAGIDVLTILFPDDVVGATGFMVGSFAGVTMTALKPAAVLIVIGLVLALVFSYDLNVLSLGEEIAASLGMRVAVVRFLFIVIASLLAGSAVSFAGLLGFIGLIVPHICRRFAGGDNRLVIPCAALLGAVFALVCDALGKWVFAPFELPVGIILALLGGPFFLFLLLKGGRGKIYD